MKLTLHHTGKLPVTGMGHSFVLLKPDVDMDEFAQAAIKAKTLIIFLLIMQMTLLHTINLFRWRRGYEINLALIRAHDYLWQVQSPRNDA
ncbi:MAG: hypothetical protein R2847_06455 [Bacteroidia bacterium]